MTGATRADRVEPVDPFDLPDWLGVSEVTWSSSSSTRQRHLVQGALAGPEELTCDLLAADQAYPEAVLTEAWRCAAHRAWSLEQVLLLQIEGRLTLAVPGTSFSADRVLEVIARLAKAVGASPERFTVALRP